MMSLEEKCDFLKNQQKEKDSAKKAMEKPVTEIVLSSSEDEEKIVYVKGEGEDDDEDDFDGVEVLDVDEDELAQCEVEVVLLSSDDEEETHADEHFPSMEEPLEQEEMKEITELEQSSLTTPTFAGLFTFSKSKHILFTKK